MNTHKIKILHISDLHIRKEDTGSNIRQFDRHLLFDPFLARLKEDYTEHQLQPELVIVSGDIAFQGDKTEYTQAAGFFREILNTLQLSAERLYLVPGNHDVNRKIYRPKDIPQYADMQELNIELEKKNYRSLLFAGLEEYFTFQQTHYPHLRIIDENLVPFVNLYPSVIGNIALVGLNSAWMCRKSPDREEIAIGEYQVKHAFNAVKGYKDVRLLIYIFHHSPVWLWPPDRKVCEGYFNHALCLTGHLHDTAGYRLEGLQSDFLHLQAGGLYLDKGSTDPDPARYQYLTIDGETGQLRLDFRCFDDEYKRWTIDPRRGKDGHKEFSLPGWEKQPAQTDRQPVSPVSTITAQVEKTQRFEKYCQYIYNQHCHLPVQGFETNFRHPILIERVYVKMRANPQFGDCALTLSARNEEKKRLQEEHIGIVDIRGAFAVSKQHEIKDLVILGDPGAGKTTLLKYLVILLIKGRAEKELGISSRIIPFYAPLRDLREPEKENFYQFLARQCKFTEMGITEADFRSLLDRRLGLILLDGLDEVADKTQRLKVIRWIDQARAELVYTPFIITSRFAGYIGKYQLTGNILPLSIQEFTDEEIGVFLKNWFTLVAEIQHPGDAEAGKRGLEDADRLQGVIAGSKDLKAFVTNPLLLQITALVYHDRGKNLPERRVDLYRECTEILLGKWDQAKDLEVKLQAGEARQLLQPVALWLHQVDERRSAPIDEIIKEMQAPLEKLGREKTDIKQLLEHIRDRSGIFVGYSEEEYGFVHLSFQEYLAAEEIRNRCLVDVLVANYSNRWWREVILLCLALDNPSVIEVFMEKIVLTKAFTREITLVQDALRDSRVKPFAVLLAALEKKKVKPEAKQNIITLLKPWQHEKVIDGLRKVVKGKDKLLIRSAYDTLQEWGKADGLTIEEKQPAPLLTGKDGAAMVLIPAGPFLCGSEENDKEARQNEKPQRIIELTAFYMDKYPVTNERYCLFLNADKHSGKELASWINLEGKYEKEQCRIKFANGSYVVEPGYANYPVIYVSWHGAAAYAEWVGKRLPTEQEWEKAARGTEGRKYPWGNEWKAGLCNSIESGIEMTTPVDKYPQGKSVYGCYDMVGNVWEWTSSFYYKDNDSYTVRGGAWYNLSDLCRCACRFINVPLNGYDLIGFRCART